ncbi:MAG: peptide-methionine (R)-S-oxide reductase MsrB [Anaerolineales bacterium]|nr:peptide-methionine (R)-S-oxide reductase MsrB [Anaerolineales bacterium]
MTKIKISLLTVFIVIMASACSVTKETTIISSTPQAPIREELSSEMTQTAIDPTYNEQEGIDVVYLAGGCFWGMEKLMQSIPGVMNVTSGYANGKAGDIPTYNSVSTGRTGYRETVRVEYNPNKVSLEAIIFAYFHVIDPTIENAQGNDRGTQYQTGIYYVDEYSKEIIERVVKVEKQRYEDFVVEIEPLTRFYDAEEYHQDYLDKNPTGYCHISQAEFQAVSNMIIDPADYPRPADEQIKAMLSEEQYRVTQNAGTEPPFQNEFWEHHERGIYVDIVTGEPLFSSSDKFDSPSGWPSFSKGIDINAFVFIKDISLGMVRTEVRSRTGNSHLGHMFSDDPHSPSGIRYCINSAALRFVAYDQMEAEGYGYLMKYVE